MEGGEIKAKEEEMTKKKRVKPYKRRKPGGTRKTVTVGGYTRSRRKKYSVRSTRKRKKKPKKNLWDIIFGD